MSPMTVAAAWLLRAGDERGNCGHQTESTVVREMAQEARWRGFQTARQREGLERGPPALFRSWNAVRLWNRGRWGLSHFLSGICPVGPFWVVRREGPGPGGPREGWYPGVDRLAREEPGSLGGDPPPSDLQVLQVLQLLHLLYLGCIGSGESEHLVPGRSRKEDEGPEPLGLAIHPPQVGGGGRGAAWNPQAGLRSSG